MHALTKKALLTLFFTLIVASVITVQPSTQQTSKEVKGIIDSNTVWTKANSPYTLTAPVAVNTGVTLTIEPGVRVNLNNFYIQVNGTLIAKGTPAELIQFNGDGSIRFTQASKSWNEQTGSGCIIQNANVSLVSVQINDASPKIDSSFLTGGVGIDGGSPIISNNKLQFFGRGDIIGVGKGSPIIISNDFSDLRFGDMGNSYTGYGIMMENASNARILNNVFHNLAYTSIVAGTSTALIENNDMMNGIDGGATLIIRKNTLGGSIVNPSSSSIIVYNNILSGGIELRGSGDVNASYNWWGTTDTSEIDRRIVDFNDDFNLGKVNYIPFLTEANTDAMPIPNAPIPTPNVTVMPSAYPTSVPSNLPSQSPSATPIQTITSNTSFDWFEVTLVALLSVIVVLLVVVAVFLRKRTLRP
jgi:hypothetical protein